MSAHAQMSCLMAAGEAQRQFATADLGMCLLQEGVEDAKGVPEVGGRKPQRFIPFSMGARDCVGQTLARLNLTTTLAQLFGSFHFKLAEEVRLSASGLVAALLPLCPCFELVRCLILLIKSHKAEPGTASFPDQGVTCDVICCRWEGLRASGQMSSPPSPSAVPRA